MECIPTENWHFDKQLAYNYYADHICYKMDISSNKWYVTYISFYWIHSHVQCCYEFAKTNGLTIRTTTMLDLILNYHLQQQNYMPKITMLTTNSCKRNLIILMPIDGNENFINTVAWYYSHVL